MKARDKIMFLTALLEGMDCLAFITPLFLINRIDRISYIKRSSSKAR
jgi:hypothetical protein